MAESLPEMLVSSGVLTEDQRDKSVKGAAQMKITFAEAVVKLGFCREDDIAIALSKQHGIPYASRENKILRAEKSQNLEKVVPEAYARQNFLLPLFQDENILAVAVSDPENVMMMDNLKLLTGLEIQPFIATKTQIIKAIDEFYLGGSVIDRTLNTQKEEGDEEISEAVMAGDERLNLDQVTADAHGAQAVSLVNAVLKQAIQERASDIHIEQYDERVGVRFRIDGDMREIYHLRTKTGLQLITSFKVQGKLDIAERRKPQDGSMQIKIDGREFIIRLATTCTPAGESLILRLLEPMVKPRPLEELGMTSQQVKHMVDFAHRNHGLVVIAGPTGSGKTTTIYSLLQHIDCKTRSLISVEDPVEYRIPSANQQQVDEKAGLTFEALLRSSLRQDPDILFLGEMRDPFSAKMAIDFASTGHLTISSVHTTNATTAIFRLERIGVTRGAMADSILGVIAQKLLKRLCPHCKREGPVADEERAWLAPFTDDIPSRVARPAGCLKCGGTGFFGREGIYEIVKFYPEISDMIRRDLPISEIRDFARARGDLLIADHGIEKVRSLIFDPRSVYEHVLIEESEYRRLSVSATPEAPAPSKPETPAIVMSMDPSAAKILIAEDDVDTRLLIQRVLENQGYAVTVAADGVEALAHLSAQTFDLFLSDVNMPNLDGLKLMEMKAQKRIDTPVIFFTAQAETEAEGLRLGAEDYVKKPVSKDVLLARVRRVLDKRRA